MSDRGDANLYHRAVKQRWPISEERRQEMVECLYEIVQSSEDTRAVNQAIRTLVMMEAQNMEQERRDLGIPEHVRISGPDGEPLNVRRIDPEALRAFAGDLARAGLSGILPDGLRQPLDTPEAPPQAAALPPAP